MGSVSFIPFKFAYQRLFQYSGKPIVLVLSPHFVCISPRQFVCCPHQTHWLGLQTAVDNCFDGNEYNLGPNQYSTFEPIIKCLETKIQNKDMCVWHNTKDKTELKNKQINKDAAVDGNSFYHAANSFICF